MGVVIRERKEYKSGEHVQTERSCFLLSCQDPACA